MKCEDNFSILYVEPGEELSDFVNDKYITKMWYLLHKYSTEFGSYDGVRKERKKIIPFFDKDSMTMGTHECTGKVKLSQGVIDCPARSLSYDIKIEHPLLPNKFAFTNSLCLHYLAWHRSSVPQSTLELIDRVIQDEEIINLPLVDKKTISNSFNIEHISKQIKEVFSFSTI